MLTRTTRRVFQHVLNPPTSPSVRFITYATFGRAGGLAVSQPSLIPELLKTPWPANLNQKLLEPDFQREAAAEIRNPDEATTPEAAETIGFNTFNPEVQDVVRDLYLAVGRNELGDIIRIFMTLMKMGALGKFMDADILKISSMLSEYLLGAPIDPQRTNAETMSIFFFFRGYIEPLQAAMSYYLLRDDADSILQLWDKYLTWKRQAARKRLEKAPHSRGVVDNRLLYVTAAAAMKDNYGIAYSAFRTSDSSFPPWRISEFTQRFLHLKDPRIRQRFHDFLYDASLSRDIYHFGPITEQVKEIGRLGDQKALINLYESIMDGISRGIFAVAGTVPVGPYIEVVDSNLWSLFIWGAVQCRSVVIAEAVMKDMPKYGLTPTIDMWTTLLKGYAKRGIVENTMKAIQKMQTQGLEPNLQCLTIIMGTLFDKQMIPAALEIFKTIQSHTPPPEDPDTENHTPMLLAAHNVALNGLLRNRDFTEADKLLQKMEKEGPQPDIVTYNTLLNRYTRMKNSQAIAATLRALANRGLRPDIYTFTILYVGASRNRDETMRTNLLKRMKTLDVQPNNALMSAAIASILGSGSSDAIPMAMDVLRKMERERDKSIQPNEVAYHTIMHSVDELVLQRGMDPKDGFNMVNVIYQRMLGRGFKPSRVTQHLLLRMHLRRQEPDSLRIALSIFDNLLKDDLLTCDSWYILLCGLEKRGEYKVAKHMIEVLRRSPLDARGSLLAVVDRINRY